MELKRILELYKKELGQKVNLEKSSMFISKNTDPQTRGEVQATLQGIKIVNQEKYLGLPLVIGRSKNDVFGCAKDRLNRKINGWKGKLLSSAGKEVLLKSVAMALPSYVMSVFKLPK
ncbi:hypothetical protein ACH5RR_004713 [Cinchona calisaya]|uniref:Reverse transcriptase n=1 Tax=Cinchona calisaya TaxID=153742 RepID=A0ABD3AYC6_9GENT